MCTSTIDFRLVFRIYVIIPTAVYTRCVYLEYIIQYFTRTTQGMRVWCFKTVFLFGLPS